MYWLALFISTTFFTGFLPGRLVGRPGVGGGLAGSIVGFLILVLCTFYGVKPMGIFLMVVASFFLGIWFVDTAEMFMVYRWGPRKKHTGETVFHDFNETNIDEVHGQFIAGWPVFFFPHLEIGTKFGILALSLVLFRILDVKKPWFIRDLERAAPGSWGIMLDDSLAGIYAAIFVLMAVYSVI